MSARRVSPSVPAATPSWLSAFRPLVGCSALAPGCCCWCWCLCDGGGALRLRCGWAREKELDAVGGTVSVSRRPGGRVCGGLRFWDLRLVVARRTYTDGRCLTRTS